MKTIPTSIATACLGLALCHSVLAQTDQKGDPSRSAAKNEMIRKQQDHITMADGRMMVVKDGKSTAMKKDMTLDDGTKVSTHGNVTMKDGKSMNLADDDMILMDGKVVKKDHLFLKDGKVMMTSDGKTTPIAKDMIFDNGTKIMTDGKVILKNGKSMVMGATDRVLMDGTMIKVPAAGANRNTN